jgi:cyanophycinase-like exopeptidase
MSDRSYALLGSGEFEPWSAEVDRRLLERTERVGPVLIAPAASAPEGEEVFQRWATMGLEHYSGLGIAAEVLPLRTREDALREDAAAKLEGASMIFFSGGNPTYLAAILADTPFWAALLTAMDAGLPYAGCSAGVACLGERAPDSAVEDFTKDFWKPGLRAFPRVVFAPHWDALDSFAPGLTELFAGSISDGERLFTIDENTAVVGDGRRWTTVGSGAARILESGSWRTFPSGEGFSSDPVGERTRSQEAAS